MAENNIVWTSTAIKQRRAILKYWTLKTHSTAYAEKLIKIINKRTQIILKYPLIYILTTHEDTRVSAMGQFSILYKIYNEGIIIVAFWDNRQNPSKLLRLITERED